MTDRQVLLNYNKFILKWDILEIVLYLLLSESQKNVYIFKWYQKEP